MACWQRAEILGLGVASILAGAFWGHSAAVRGLLVVVAGVSALSFLGLPRRTSVQGKCIEEDEPKSKHANQAQKAPCPGHKVCPCGEHELGDEDCPHHKDFWREFIQEEAEEEAPEEDAGNLADVLETVGELADGGPDDEAVSDEADEEQEDEEDSCELGDAFQIMRDMGAEDFYKVTYQNEGGHQEELPTAAADEDVEEKVSGDSENTQQEQFPWRRSARALAEPADAALAKKPAWKRMSTKAPEFVPQSTRSKLFSVAAPEFVPRWAREESDIQAAIVSKEASKLPPWKRTELKSSTPDLEDEDVCSESQSMPFSKLLSPVSCGTTESDVGTSKLDSDATISEDSAEEDSIDELPAYAEQCQVAIFEVSELLKWRSADGNDNISTQEVPGRLIAEVAESAPLLEASLPSPTFSSWRREAEERWESRSEVATPTDKSKLQVSENSWAAKQRARRSQQGDCSSVKTDEEIVRAMKLILNKLTIEKFPQLYEQMLSCGIRTSGHLEQLIREVFEKATTQHHFIDMYADLCAQLHMHFTQNPITDNANASFKRILLNACQASFEKYLSLSQDFASLAPEERLEAEIKHKMCMLGNIRFIGALLVRKMLASKVMLAIAAELLSGSTPEALETLAALLTAVGAEFDTPTFMHRAALDAIFHQVHTLAKQSSTPPRVRFLIKDVLDLRSSGWLDKKPKKMEKPTTLEEVHQRAARED